MQPMASSIGPHVAHDDKALVGLDCLGNPDEGTVRVHVPPYRSSSGCSGSPFCRRIRGEIERLENIDHPGASLDGRIQLEVQLRRDLEDHPPCQPGLQFLPVIVQLGKDAFAPSEPPPKTLTYTCACLRSGVMIDVLDGDQLREVNSRTNKIPELPLHQFFDIVPHDVSSPIPRAPA